VDRKCEAPDNGPGLFRISAGYFPFFATFFFAGAFFFAAFFAAFFFAIRASGRK
jgi:hypothetical protein